MRRWASTAAVRLGLLGLCLGSGWRAQAAESEPDSSLRVLAERAGLTLGVAVDTPVLNGDHAHAALAARHFHVLTPENALKWGHVEWQQGRRDTRAFEAIAAFAAANSQGLRGHALVWDREIPAWLSRDDPRVFDAALADHLQATMSDHRDLIEVWDVVNEALGPDGHRAPSSLVEVLGPSYLETAFLRARAEAPQARLFYNDYAVLWPGPKADGLVRLVKALQQAHVPIDGVGLQSHLHLVPEGRLDWPGIRAHLRRLGALGVEIHLSEVDVRVADLAGADQGRLLAQADAVYRLVSVCRLEPACTHVAFWGVSDRYSWIDTAIGPDDPLLWDEQAAPKPAYFAVQDALLGRPWRGCTTNISGVGPSLETVTTTGGRLRRSLESSQAEVVVTDRTASWHGPQVDVRAWLSEGLTFRLSAEVQTAEGMPLQWTLRVVDGGGTRFLKVTETVATGAWQSLEGLLQVDLQPPVETVHAYVEGPNAGHDLALRSVSATVACAPSEATSP